MFEIKTIGEVFQGLKISDFNRVLRLCVCESGVDIDGRCLYAMNIRLLASSVDITAWIDLNLDDVRDVRLNGVGGQMILIPGLDLLDIRNKGWDRVSWELIDKEDGLLHAYANAAYIAGYGTDRPV